jgi:hypothetical protein
LALHIIFLFSNLPMMTRVVETRKTRTVYLELFLLMTKLFMDLTMQTLVIEVPVLLIGEFS